MPDKFEPYEAYAATLSVDGSIVVQDLSNPGISVVIVVGFELNGVYHKAVYHQSMDAWEWLGALGSYGIIFPNDPLYTYANRTAEFFADRLLDGPNDNYFVRKMAQHIVEGIDR